MINRIINYSKNNTLKSLIIALLIIVFIVWLIWSNISIEVKHYVVSDNKIPSSFDGFKIAHVSDLHNAEFGKNNKNLIEKIRDATPDIIVITGDIVDRFHTDIDVSLDFIKQAVEIAPCYYITGNHEAWLERLTFLEFEKQMLSLGVVILHGESISIDKNGESILLAGVDDPDYSSAFLSKLSKMVSKDCFTILLSHRPEYFEEYVINGYDLVLSGHAHGGQFRLPLLGGLLAPNQGWFPKYDSGVYNKNGTTMIVSRGIGNSVVPIRFNNRPELIIVELSSKSEK